MESMAHVDPDTRFKLLIDSSEKAVNLVQNLPIRLYMRSGKEVLRTARLFENAGNEEHAFMLYHRFVCLFLTKVRALPDYKDASKEDKEFIKYRAKEILPKLEQLKASIKLRYQREYNDFKEQEAIAENERKQLAALDASRRAAEQQKIQPVEDENQRRFREAQEKLVRNRETAQFVPPSAPPLRPDSPERRILAEEFAKKATVALPKPESEQITCSYRNATPCVDRSTKPKSNSYYVYPPPLDLGHSTQPEQVVLPEKLIPLFEKVAESNTMSNIETCGILLGTRKNNQFVITDLLIPKQRGTSDSCDALNEEELIPVTEAKSLFILGWIHTHPSQTAFLSSIDLHTQFNYQSTLLSSIGIVCATAHQQIGVFSLTDLGLTTISTCRQQGHHVHSKPDLLYEEAKHVIRDYKADVELVDLRKQ